MSTQTEVKTDPLKEIFEALFTLLETLETNNAAILQFLQDQGINGEKLAPYLKRAGNASNVKMLAARKRMEYLLTHIQKENAPSNNEKEQAQEKENEKEKREAKPEEAAETKNENKGKEEKDKDEKRSAEPAQSEVRTDKPPTNTENTPGSQEHAQQ